MKINAIALRSSWKLAYNITKLLKHPEGDKEAQIATRVSEIPLLFKNVIFVFCLLHYLLTVISKAIRSYIQSDHFVDQMDLIIRVYI